MATKAPNDLSVVLLAAAGGDVWKRTETNLGALGTAITAHDAEDRLAVVFGAIGAGAAQRLSVAFSNGLAG